ncbi:hypothetical protein BKA59DRAFT_509186 [Fusarium tricinctum]|uniref:CCHC-type domain-containing protein n=1 Tax=Fusarium tricinctum TaxID=61284 RepID=A0A8K0RZ49_9HYPO|nr:hypothetical protein BKA59DRAFT_509186 [Fusarium tricinctum]
MTGNNSLLKVCLRFSNLETALKLDGSKQSVYGQPYTMKAVGPQGTPLFCFNCGKPAHFKYQCTTHRRCGRCSADHDTRECTVRDRADYCCPNCDGHHAAWDTACNNRNSQLQHDLSRHHRKIGPDWARVNRLQPNNANSSQAQPSVASENSATVPSTSQASSSAASSSASPSQATLKRGRGRPRKGPKAEAVPQQPVGTPPASEKRDHHDIKEMFGRGGSSSVASSSRTTTRTPTNMPSSSKTTQSNMAEDPSSSKGISDGSAMDVDLESPDCEMTDGGQPSATNSTTLVSEPAEDSASKKGKGRPKPWHSNRNRRKGKGKAIAEDTQTTQASEEDKSQDKGKGIAEAPKSGKKRRASQF